MKKVLFLLALLLGSNLTFAQISKGSFLVSGAASLNTSTSENTINNITSDGPRDVNLSLVPNVSYFITEKFAVGLEFVFTNNTRENVTVFGNNTTTTKSLNRTFAFGPFVRYYVPLGQKFYFYSQAGFGISSGGTESTRTSVTTLGNTTTTNETKTTSDIKGFNIGIRPGITYFLSNRFAIDASFGLIGFQNATVKDDGDTFKSTEFDFNIIPNTINFGLIYRFGGTTAQ